MLRYLDSKGKLQIFSPMKSYSHLLYQRTCYFNVLIDSSRLYQQYLCEMFVKVECEKLSFLWHNQSELRASDYTHLCELHADSAVNKNEVRE